MGPSFVWYQLLGLRPYWKRTVGGKHVWPHNDFLLEMSWYGPAFLSVTAIVILLCYLNLLALLTYLIWNGSITNLLSVFCHSNFRRRRCWGWGEIHGCFHFTPSVQNVKNTFTDHLLRAEKYKHVAMKGNHCTRKIIFFYQENDHEN